MTSSSPTTGASTSDTDAWEVELPPFRAPSGLHPLLHGRWSTRAFDPAGEVGPQQAARLLEAVRWAPSASNTQPWRVLLGVRGTREHAVLLDTLMGFNRRWAGDAGALVLLASARTAEVDGARKELRWADLDVGQALAHLTVQAAADGLVVHAMGGFDVDALRSAVVVPEGVEPLVVVAVGVQGDLERLEEEARLRETTRERRPLEELRLGLRAGRD